MSTIGPVHLNITTRQFADQIVAAIEGGCNYWCDGFYLESPGDVAPDDPHEGPWYDNPRRYEDPDLLLKVVVKDADLDQDIHTDHLIGQQEIADGLQKLAEKYPRRLAEIVEDNGDAETADTMLQMIVFGELVYG